MVYVYNIWCILVYINSLYSIEHFFFHISIEWNDWIRKLNGFYRGMFFPLCLGGAQNSLFFGIYGYNVRKLQSTCETEREKRSKRQLHTFMAGSTAGLIHSFFACPLELIKIRLQTQNCKTFCFLPQVADMSMIVKNLYSQKTLYIYILHPIFI